MKRDERIGKELRTRKGRLLMVPHLEKEWKGKGGGREWFDSYQKLN
jgi:hypothetical protein